MSRLATRRPTARLTTARRRSALAALVVALVPFVPVTAGAETVYVSDNLQITFRASPSNRGEIVKILESGTALEVLERHPDGDWARVTTRAGTEGWVRTQYLAEQPIARDRLETATRELERLRSTVAELRARLETVQAERGQARESATGLEAQVNRLEQELAEIKQVSASAIETAEANQRLEELNARLREEMSAVVNERDRLASNAEQRWLMIGGGLVVTGLLLGVIIKSRPRRSAWA